MSDNVSHEHDKDSQKTLVRSDLISKFLDTQIKEFEIKQQGEENKKQIAKYNFELAKQSLNAQENDRKEEREYKKNCFKWGIIAGSVISICVLLFFAVALAYDKEAFVLELVKILFYGGSGVAVGSSWEKSKQYFTLRNKE